LTKNNQLYKSKGASFALGARALFLCMFHKLLFDRQPFSLTHQVHTLCVPYTRARRKFVSPSTSVRA